MNKRQPLSFVSTALGDGWLEQYLRDANERVYREAPSPFCLGYIEVVTPFTCEATVRIGSSEDKPTIPPPAPIGKVCPRCNQAMRWQCANCGTSGGKVPPKDAP